MKYHVNLFAIRLVTSLRAIYKNPYLLFRAGLLACVFLLVVFLNVEALAQAVQERIHFGDIVDVDVVGSFEFDWRGGLTPEGFLDGLERAEKPVHALCHTESEVAASIADQYRRVLRAPNVIVRIIDRSNRALAYVTGAVRKPQRFQLRRSVSLAEMIVLSGGITDGSNGEIVIFRPPNVNCRGPVGDASAMRKISDSQAPERFSVKIADLLSGKPDANPRVVSGDIVSVIEAPPVFLIGDVTTPRRMNLTPSLTLLRAIAAAGGLSREYSGQKARIHRRKPETKILEFELRKIMDGKAEDPKLEPYDVIEIEQKGFETRKIAPLPDPKDANSEMRSKLPLRIVD